MSDLILVLTALYTTGVAMGLMLGVVFMQGNWRNRRAGARLLILAPIWPLALAYQLRHLPRWVRNLFDLADFGDKR